MKTEVWKNPDPPLQAVRGSRFAGRLLRKRPAKFGLAMLANSISNIRSIVNVNEFAADNLAGSHASVRPMATISSLRHARELAYRLASGGNLYGIESVRK